VGKVLAVESQQVVPTVLVFAGPTASGKSRAAVAAAEAFGGVVINADSMQMYRDLPILTAQPGAEERRAVPHLLYGILSADDPGSAGRWVTLAAAEIRRALATGHLPILVGGTGLYLKALFEGLSPVPDIPLDVREAGRQLHARLGGVVFRSELKRRDPIMADRLGAGDSQRLMRAWEVLEATGRSLADWQAETTAGALPATRYGTILFAPAREELCEATDRRFEAMLEAGAMAEVEKLAARRLDPRLPAMKALGVPHLLHYLRGEASLEEAKVRAKTATRKYAKRQGTWFRHQLKPDFTVNAQYSESLREEIFSFIRQILLTKDS
jgi:tRNA dimethylallyltransferase